MVDDILDDWMEELDITPEEARNQDISATEIRDAIEDWSTGTKIRWLYKFLPQQKQHSGSMKNTEKIDTVIARSVKLYQALQFYKEKAQHT